LLQSFL
jgi:acyl-CoA oxidase